jgi:UDP:flavonoid glycosyltransferase YjiC (YdhE family)
VATPPRVSPPLRVFIGAFGDAGHAFPAIALGVQLVRRGHEVAIETWQRWGEHVEAAGIRFFPAPEYQVFPTRERPLKPYEAVVRAVEETRPSIRDFRPDVVVNDVLTLAPALSAELERVPRATLVPHFYPPDTPGSPPYGLGAMPARGPLGKAFWRAVREPIGRGVERGRRELNETRRRVGLPALGRPHGGISDRLCIVGTFPQLEYPRRWPAHVHVTGPLVWQPPGGEHEWPPGDGARVLVAPSTAQDPEQTLLKAALAGLERLPVRVLAVRRPGTAGLSTPSNTRVVEWVSYERAMPRASLVICHAGHGTLATSLSWGAPVVTVPAAGDMAENGARAQWAGAGLNLPGRFLCATTLRWTVERALERPGLGTRARELAGWAHTHDGAEAAAKLVERLAAAERRPGRGAGATGDS